MTGANGLLSPEELAPIAGGELRKDAAAAFNAMNQEARIRGLELRPTGSKSSYRSLAQQRELWQLYVSGRGNLAAKPGSSNHGWGLAIDLATPEMRDMVDAIGAKYGFSKRCSDAQSEWWHLKFDPVCTGATWRGEDPGPEGPIPKLPEETMDIAASHMPDGRQEIYVVTADGTVYHAWNSKDGSGGGWHRNKDGGFWESMGKPGK